jgi:hypothetical protein
MARILLLDGDACLWNSVCDILEGEGYTVWRAHHEYEGLSFALTGFLTLTRGTVLYIVVFDVHDHPCCLALFLSLCPSPKDLQPPSSEALLTAGWKETIQNSLAILLR